MLQKLSIQNFALIDELEFEPSGQFTSITGETGAGKSIILGALNLLTGARADIKVLLDDTKKCVIEAHFQIKKLYLKHFFEENDLEFEELTIIRREISPQGKSRAFINDSPVNLEVLSQLADYLIDIHSQHDNLLISNASFQLNFIDAFVENEQNLKNYQKCFRKYKSLIKEIEKLKNDESSSRKEYDYDIFLLEELTKYNFQDGEQETLESELAVLENTDEIKQKLNSSNEILDNQELSLLNGFHLLHQQFNQLSKISSNFEDLKQRINSIYSETKDISQEIKRLEEKTELDPERMAEVKERVDYLFKLYKKHGVNTISELQFIKKNLEEKTAYFGSLSDSILKVENEINSTEQELSALAKLLSENRKSKFEEIKQLITNNIQPLGIPNASIEIESQLIPFSDNGIDKIQILFSANKGVSPSPIKNASGGELSRLMFVIKYILAEKTALPTMVFDEIDTGISGDIAIKMAEMMRKIAINQQVITITHLHQIAAKGHKHFFVYKNEQNDVTQTKIKLLDNIERVTKIAEMIGGKNPSASAIESAKEFLKN